MYFDPKVFPQGITRHQFSTLWKCANFGQTNHFHNHSSTLASLLRRGFIVKLDEDKYGITDAGRAMYDDVQAWRKEQDEFERSWMTRQSDGTWKANDCPPIDTAERFAYLLNREGYDVQVVNS